MDSAKQKSHAGIEPKRDFFKNIKWVVRAFFDEEGEFIDIATTKTSPFCQMKNEAPEQFNLLRDILTHYIKEDGHEPVVKAWLLQCRNMSQAQFAEEKGMKGNTFYVRLRRDRERFMVAFGEWCLYELADCNGTQYKSKNYLPESELEQYRKRLLSQKNDIRKLQNNILIGLEPFAKEETAYMESEEFNGLCCELWSKASRPVANELVERCKEKGFFGYLNHLMRTPNKTDKEWQDFRQIVRMIAGEAPVLINQNI